MLRFDAADFRYEPFPIGIIKPAMDGDLYRKLVDTFPPHDLFMYFPKVGSKYVLSEKFNAKHYHDYIRSHPEWTAFHEWIKSQRFILNTLACLQQHNIDLGIRYFPVSLRRRLKATWRHLKAGLWPRYDIDLSARFEFSMLSADGGCVTPHTDSPGKLITLVVSMVGEGGWEPSLGGGTDVNRPKDPRRVFNEVNDKLGFDEVEVLHTYPFEPNQTVIFVKTFNSWHSVRPMTGQGVPLLRRTLTINIEERRP
jgi:hypothetical protein